MFKTLVGASLAALFFSSVSVANVPGVTEGDEGSTPEMFSLLLVNADQDAHPVAPVEMKLFASAEAKDDAIPTAEMLLLFAHNEEGDVLPTERLAQIEDDAIPTAEMMAPLFVQNEESDVLPAERLAQVEDDAIPAAEMMAFLLFAQNEESDVLPAERLAQVQQDDDAIPAAEMLLLFADAQDAVDVLPTDIG